MKKRLFIAFAMLAVFGLAIAAYAYNRTTLVAGDDKPACCKKSDSCPMKGKMDHEKSGEHAKGEHKCCGDSCPMKAEGGDHAKADGHNCCGCCGDSCPMKKNGETKGTAVTTSGEDSKSCCDGCACCKAKEKTATV